MFKKMCEHSSGWRPEDGVPDLSMMSDITDRGINLNLRVRYQRDEIYTYSGSILIAVNPYKPLEIYDQQWIARFRAQKFDQTDPHVFAIAESMYMNLVLHDLNQGEHGKQDNQNGHRSLSKNQACVISGESGAGKTETTKFILSYLCSVTPNRSTWMEHQIIEANTILEAFGNAKTVRNDNSSRFGKFIQVCFDSKNQIKGCIIQHYLLEQSRITFQSTGERNYHVFYQLLAAGQANKELRSKFHLMPPNFYDYLNMSQCFSIEGVDDCSMFDSLRMALSVLNMEQECCDGLFSVLSAILWLGNLQFECDDTSQVERCKLTENDRQIMEIVAQLLGVPIDKLEPITLRRQINVCGNITEIPFKIHEARDNRNGMAKALYSRLFTWVVNFINGSTNPGSENQCFLGVLDIFGFENFEQNSFEQLCINYANEKLHKFFNHHMFAMEQDLYRREGIDFCDINYTDNTPCLELLERPPNCILRLLSEECRMPKGSDSTFLEKLHSEFATCNPHPYYHKGNDRRNWSIEFSVRHFAGSVTYTADGFLKKNKDAQQNQLLDILESASNPLLRELVNCNASSENCEPPMRPNMIRRESADLCMVGKSSFDNDQKPSNFNRPRLMSQKSLVSSLSIKSTSPSSKDTSFSFALDQVVAHQARPSIGGSSKSRPTVADKFRQQLTSLVDLLNSVQPWYVRCIKPNLEKSATGYDDRQVLLQLRYLGMSDLIMIRREGFPVHLTKHQFVCRYRCLMLRHLRENQAIPSISIDDASLHSSCLRIMGHFDLDKTHWRIGKTMVFLKAHIYQPMETRRNNLFVQMATLIQSVWRCYKCKKTFQLKRSSAKKIQDTFRSYRDRLVYMRKKRAVLTIQAYTRGMFARDIAEALREIKRQEKRRKIAELETQEQASKLLEQKPAEESHRSTIQCQIEEAEKNSSSTGDQLQILITEPVGGSSMDNLQTSGASNTAASSPSGQSNVVSPAVSSSASWVGQDPNSYESKRRALYRDRKEMEELVKVLEHHGLSLDALEQANSGTCYADFDKLYDILGAQIPAEAIGSVSPQITNDGDDRCSLGTTATNCDGDSVSMVSGQSQVSSTLADETSGNKIDGQDRVADDSVSVGRSTSRTPETVNGYNDQGEALDEDRFHSNSVESIPSIESNTSPQIQQTIPPPPPEPLSSEDATASECEALLKQVIESTSRTSTFTGAPLIVAGSKLVTQGRPLTRIEEEPNSIASSPTKTPKRSNFGSKSRPQSLFPATEELLEGESPVSNGSLKVCLENKRRRLERKILQVQQEQLQQPVVPTTAGSLAGVIQGQPQSNMAPQAQSYQNQSNPTKLASTNPSHGGHLTQNSTFNDNIYSDQKCSIIEFAEHEFNNHPRETGSGGVMRTLTRRRRSVDINMGENLTKGEMLSYNPTFSIPTSHFKMQDPHAAQIACTLFKNLCKYMTGEASKSDTEVRIIQSIARHGIEKSELRDEIYVQIIRQLTNNQNQEYCQRLWVLMGLISASFSPGKAFQKHLLAYLRSKPRRDPSVTCQAQFCLDNLLAPRINHRKKPPSLLEIQACKNLVNLTCKIYILDGRCETVSIHPCDTALDTLAKLAHKLELRSIEGWALYESYTPGSSKYPHPEFDRKGDFERSVRSHCFMADILAVWQDGDSKKHTSGSANNASAGGTLSLKIAQKRVDEGSFRLTLKKKIFRGPSIQSDPVEINLLYAQAVYNVVKKDSFLVDESLALSLAGLQAQVNLGNSSDLERSTKESKKGKQVRSNTMKNPTLVYELENYICQRLRHQATVNRSKKEWTLLISQAHRQFQGRNDSFTCKMLYLTMVIKHCPLYGTATFKVYYKGYQGLDQNLLLGVNSEGLLLIKINDRSLVYAYRYNEICTDKGITVYAGENIIQFNIRDRNDKAQIKCLSFESSENEEIALLMVNYSSNLKVTIRGVANSANYTHDPIFDSAGFKKKPKLKMTLEDRMRTHQEVQNARRGIIKSGKLRRPMLDEQVGILKNTLRRLSVTSSSKGGKSDSRPLRESIYGTLTRSRVNKHNPDSLPQTNSDYNLYSLMNSSSPNQRDSDQGHAEVAGATAPSSVDELMKNYPHRYWAYTIRPIRNSLLTIHDPELEEAALSNFTAILTYSGLIASYASGTEAINCNTSGQDSNGSIDSGIASNSNSIYATRSGPSDGSPSSSSSGDNIYDVCPKKMDERELIRLAQNILDKCLKKDADILKNEFFLQLIKQTTDHPDTSGEINQRHWQLLALACSTTFPSDGKILNYLFAHLRRCSLDQVTVEGQYAQFTLRSLQGTLDSRGRRLAPSETEILSTINCRRVYARVYFLDGNFQVVEFDPSATIAQIVDEIKHKIGLRPKCQGYALFQPLDDECEQVLNPEEKAGDAIASWEAWQRQKQNQQPHQQQTTRQQVNQSGAKASLASLSNLSSQKNRTHKFVFKRYLFLDSMIDMTDKVERELLYLQTVAAIRADKFPVLEHEATILCAIKAQIDRGSYSQLAELSREQVRLEYKKVIMSLMPPHAFNNLPVQAIAQQHQAFGDTSPSDTKQYFFNLIHNFGRANLPNSPGNILLHRAHIYEAAQTFATAWPTNIWIIVNQTGLHMLVAKSRRVLASCEYRQLVDYSANNNYLMLIASTSNQSRVKYTFYTKHAQQINQQMRSYVVACSAAAGTRRRKSVEFNLQRQTTDSRLQIGSVGHHSAGKTQNGVQVR